jgi:tetratricopeptide (TPR) repeat protein
MTQRFYLILLAGLSLLALSACVEQARNAIPFLPPSKYVDVGGRQLTREEAAYYQKIKDLSRATKINPRDAVAFNAIGELAQKKGWFSVAKECYFKSIAIDDTLSEGHHNLGLIFIYEDRMTEALDQLNKAKNLSPDDARIRHRLGMAKAGLMKQAEALKEYDEAIALDAEYTPAYLEKARLLYSQRKYAEAAATCRLALQNIPKTDVHAVAKESRGNSIIDKILPVGSVEEVVPKTWKQEAAFDLALCLKAQGQFNEALNVLLQADGTEEARLDVQMLRAKLLEADNRAAEALAILEPLRTAFPDRAEIPKRMAQIYQKSGQKDLAIKTRLEAAELDQADRELQEEAARNAVEKKDTARAIAIFERLVRVDGENIRYRRQLAKAYDDSGIVRQAALQYQEIVNREPQDTATRRRMAMIFSDLPGFQGRATFHLAEIVKQNPKDAEAYRRLGELALQSRNFVEAEKYIKLTLQYTPNDAKAHHNLATLYTNQNRYEDAVEGYKKALKLDAAYATAYVNLARTMRYLNRHEEVVEPLRAYLKMQPTDEEAMRMLADSLRIIGRREEAIQEYEAIAALKVGDVDASLKLAELQTGLGRPKSAAGLYETILEKNPSNIDALKEAARLYSGMDMPLRTVYCWQRVLTLKPGDLEAQKRLAEAYVKIGSDEAAIKYFQVVGKSGDAEAWKATAELHIKRGERDLAVQAYREAIKIKNQDIDARRQLTSLLHNSPNQEERDEALKLYQEMTQLDAKDYSARLNLGNMLSEANRLSESQDEYDAILRDKPEHTRALIGLAVVQRKRGKYERALEVYNQALKSKPEGSDLRVIHFNMALIYDYYVNDRPKARPHYERYLEHGGDPSKLPENAGAPVDARKANKIESTRPVADEATKTSSN